MFTQGIKIFKLILMFSLCVICITSCDNSIKKKTRPNKVNDKDYDKYVSQNFDTYEHIYYDIKDTLKVWVNKKIEPAGSTIFNEYVVDSLIVLNLRKDRLYTSINILSKTSSKLENIYGFRGHLIDGKWYFTMGATYSCYRSKYKDNLNEPFTFEQLSYLARTKYIGRFLKENEQGELVPNEEKFQDYFVNGFAGPDSKLEEIEAFIKKEIYYYHRDTLDQATIDDITQDVAKRKAAVLSAPPREYEKTSPPKLFDREAWKNRHKVDKE